MTRHLLILGLLGLAACATPYEQCQRTATKDLRVLDSLIEETKLNISRGYALEEELVVQPSFNWCFGNYGYNTGVSWCSGTNTYTRDVPVAIDLDDERRKLSQMERQRKELAPRAQQGLAACQAEFGESATL